MMVKRVLIVLASIAFLYGLYLNAYSVIHGDLNFFNDVARDFLLLREVDQKKLVLIGPRTNESGLYHGPLWSYINYPAYAFGHGNPVTVAWFWIFLLVIFLITSYFMIKRVISPFAGLLFMMLIEVRVAPHMNGLIHALAAYLFMPTLFFSILEYIKTKKVRYLVVHFITLAFMIQLNVGPGGSLCILGILLSLGFIIKNRLWKHLPIFFIIPLFLINYIIFNLRHNFLMLQPVIHIMTSSKLFVTFDFWIRNRVENTISLQILQNGSSNPYHLLEILFILIVLCTIIRIKRKEHTVFYGLLMYFYFGYMLLSFINKGVILGHYVFFLLPLTTLWLVSFIEKKYTLVFLPLAIIVYYLNLISSHQYVDYLQSAFIGNSPYSWVSLSTVAKKVISDEKGNEFGYFVFSPDSYAYQPRYAMIYHFERTHTKALEYVKKPVTYVIAAPPPPGDPYMNEIWWIKNQVHISSEPVNIEPFPSGYKIEKFLLTSEEQKIPHDKNIELGLTFR